MGMMNTMEIMIHIKDTGIRIRSKCCRCGRLNVGNRWVHLPSLREDKRLFSHGLCPTCAVEEWGRLTEPESSTTDDRFRCRSLTMPPATVGWGS
jgi:hypothetical protein